MAHRVITSVTGGESVEREFDLWTDAVAEYARRVAEFASMADGASMSTSPDGHYVRAFLLFDRGGDVSVEAFRC